MPDEKKENVVDRLITFFNKKAQQAEEEKVEELTLHSVAFLIKTVAEEMLKVVGRINEMSTAINKHSEVINEMALVQEMIIQKLKADNELQNQTNRVLKREDMN
jgi:hypothetical protein